MDFMAAEFWPEFWYYVGALLAFGIGLGCGSYATMPYYRLANNVPCAGKWLGKRSACPQCNVELRTRDLVPVFNRIWNDGVCFSCGSEIPLTYWMIEFAASVSAVLLYVAYGFSEPFLTSYGAVVCVITLMASDWSYRKMPNALLIVMLLFGAFAMETMMLFDHLQTFFVGVVMCVGYATLYEQIKRTPFLRYDTLGLICLAAIWMSYLQYLAFLLTVMWLSIGFYVLTRYVFNFKRTPPYGMVIAGLLLAYLVLMPFLVV